MATTMEEFDLYPAPGGRVATFAPPWSGYVDAKLLGVANTAETFTVPAGAKLVILNGTMDFFAQYNGTAAVPGDTSDGSASILNPTQRRCAAGDTISVVSAYAGCVVTAEYYGGDV